jgi:serine-type D-Ala-D-Ala carboxypeptidase (penicillin-binding protein 5/6)
MYYIKHDKARRIFSSLLVLVLVFTVLTPSAYAFSDKSLAGQSAVLMDLDSKSVIYDKNMNSKMYPASLTKVMTCILALEKLDMNQIVKVGTSVYDAYGTRIYIEVGEEISVKDLIYGLMLRSANDAAIELAIAHSGSIEKFAKAMNDKAREIGAMNTNFVTPNGLPNDDHYTTAYDMALITEYAMRNPVFRDIVKTPRYTIAPTNKYEKERELINSNKLLEGVGNYNVEMDGKTVPIADKNVTGVKNGYTDDAGFCLISSISENGRNLVAVVLKSKGKSIYTDVKSLLEYGVSQTGRVRLFEAGSQVGVLTLDDGKKMSLYTKTNIDAYAPDGTTKDDLKTEVRASVLKTKSPTPETVMGYLDIKLKDKTVTVVPLYSSGITTKSGSMSDEIKKYKSLFSPTKADLARYGAIIVATLLLWRTAMTIINVVRMRFRKAVDDYLNKQ